MYFLFDMSKWLSGVASGLMGAMEQGVRTLSFSLATIIYRLIINLYDLFEALCTARILDNTLLKELSTRVGLVLGIVMFFNVAFAFIKILIDPDSIEDKEKGAVAIIKKVLLVIVMLGMSNFVFDTLYYVQKAIIKEHIINNLILPYKISDDDMEKFGAILSEELMYSFYQLETFSTVTDMSNDESNKITMCKNMVTAFRNQIINQNRFDLGYNCLNESIKVNINTGGSAGTQEQEVFLINYNWALCILVGIFVVYLLFMYCLKIGVRMIQLTFLEIISPMAIVSYLSPKKDTMFNKWTEIYISTYIDVFIRIAIISFVIFLVATILTVNPEEGFIFWDSVGNPTDTFTKIFFKVVIILSLLTFAKKAPDLIKELMPPSASKLGFGAGMKDIVGLEKGAKIGAGIIGGAVGGAAVGLIAGRPLGAIGGALKGGFGGLKGQGLGKSFSGAWKNQSKANAEIAKVRMNGGNWFGHQVASFQKAVGMPTAADRYDDDKSTLEKENAAYQQLTDLYDKSKKRAESKILDGKFNTDTEGLKAYSAHQNLEALKQRLGNIKRSDYSPDAVGEAKFNADVSKIQSDIQAAQIDYNDAIDKAVSGFMDRGGDAVIANNMSIAQGIIDNNQKMDFGTKKISNFSEFDTANVQSNKNITKNTNQLARNKKEGKAARANAGK